MPTRDDTGATGFRGWPVGDIAIGLGKPDYSNVYGASGIRITKPKQDEPEISKPEVKLNSRFDLLLGKK